MSREKLQKFTPEQADKIARVKDNEVRDINLKAIAKSIGRTIDDVRKKWYYEVGKKKDKKKISSMFSSSSSVIPELEMMEIKTDILSPSRGTTLLKQQFTTKLQSILPNLDVYKGNIPIPKNMENVAREVFNGSPFNKNTYTISKIPDNPKVVRIFRTQ